MVGFLLDWDGEEIRAFWANVSGSFSVSVAVDEGVCGGFAPSDDGGDSAAKGFGAFDEELFVEKGFALAESPWLDGAAPKRLAPRSCFGVWFWFGFSF